MPAVIPEEKIALIPEEIKIPVLVILRAVLSPHLLQKEDQKKILRWMKNKKGMMDNGIMEGST